MGDLEQLAEMENAPPPGQSEMKEWVTGFEASVAAAQAKEESQSAEPAAEDSDMESAAPRAAR